MSNRLVARGRVRTQHLVAGFHTNHASSNPTQSCQDLLREKPQQPDKYVLAHMNYAKLKAPMDHPSMHEFQAAMGPVNDLAKSTPGFIWSLDDAAEQRKLVPLLVDDPLLMPQMSLWESVASIQHFAFKSGHAMYLKRKREWFTVPCEDQPFAVCWWWRMTCDNDDDDEEEEIEKLSGHRRPTLKDAFDRLAILQERGPSLDAFDFKSSKRFPAPAAGK